MPINERTANLAILCSTTGLEPDDVLAAPQRHLITLSAGGEVKFADVEAMNREEIRVTSSSVFYVAQDIVRAALWGERHIDGPMQHYEGQEILYSHRPISGVPWLCSEVARWGLRHTEERILKSIEVLESNTGNQFLCRIYAAVEEPHPRPWKDSYESFMADPGPESAWAWRQARTDIRDPPHLALARYPTVGAFPPGLDGYLSYGNQVMNIRRPATKWLLRLCGRLDLSAVEGEMDHLAVTAAIEALYKLPFGCMGYSFGTVDGIKRTVAELVELCRKVGVDDTPPSDLMEFETWYVPGSISRGANGSLGDAESDLSRRSTRKWGAAKGIVN